MIAVSWSGRAQLGGWYNGATVSVNWDIGNGPRSSANYHEPKFVNENVGSRANLGGSSERASSWGLSFPGTGMRCSGYNNGPLGAYTSVGSLNGTRNSDSDSEELLSQTFVFH